MLLHHPSQKMAADAARKTKPVKAGIILPIMLVERRLEHADDGQYPFMSVTNAPMSMTPCVPPVYADEGGEADGGLPDRPEDVMSICILQKQINTTSYTSSQRIKCMALCMNLLFRSCYVDPAHNKLVFLQLANKICDLRLFCGSGPHWSEACVVHCHGQVGKADGLAK